MRIKLSSNVLQILQGLQSFSAPGSVPGDVPLEPTDTLLGVLAFGRSTAAVLLDSGVYLKIKDEWHLVPYAAITVQLPLDAAADSPLILNTSHGSVEILSGAPDAREVGRFFTNCAQDAT